jgi:AraC-like DNA-binding protein
MLTEPVTRNDATPCSINDAPQMRGCAQNQLATERFDLANAGLPVPRNSVGSVRNRSAVGTNRPVVSIFPKKAVTRRTSTWIGMGAELIQTTGYERTEFRFRAPVHLLIVYEQGARRNGETYVEGLPPSTLRDLTRKLTFVPAGHEYREWLEPRTDARIVYFYFDAVESQIKSEIGEGTLAPKMFFEEATVWETALKLLQLVRASSAEDQRYIQAVGAVLAHELARLGRGATYQKPLTRGGLASWQQRKVAEYIEANLANSIPLAALAKLVQLSPYHFCRAFKQSFGMPPHRYHMSQRIEHAKKLLVERTLSVTEIGLTLGFSETSSFSTAFRKTTGLTPTAFYRSLS